MLITQEEEPMDEEMNGDGRIEQHFFGKVDECDEGMEQDEVKEVRLRSLT